jgi:ATP-dependent DNA helicase PIF1
MNIVQKIKDILGIQSVNIGELNKRATVNIDIKKRISHPFPIDNIEVTDEYKKVQKLIEEGVPLIFLTGNAGTGKSTLIRFLRNALKKHLVVVAPTGVAALNVDGVTIHSFFRLPPRIHNDDDIQLVDDRKLYKKLELIILDEVSMARCDLLDSMDKFLRKNRENDIPFGGVQMLLVGDLFQLPPVVKPNERSVLIAKGYTSRYFFSSFCLQRSLLTHLELTSIYRQKDVQFVTLLNNIRIGENIESTIAEINDNCVNQEEIIPDITLTCTNDRADAINHRELTQIQSNEYSFFGKIEGRFNIEEDRLPAPINLKLKVGAHVMFTKNDEQKRWVNGTLGIIQQIYDDSISVKIITDQQNSAVDVRKASWETYKYVYDEYSDSIVIETVGKYIQYPLMLAWAVTIHKSQGKTLEKVLIDLGNGAFDSGQLYVAMSRCRSIEGIRLVRPIRMTDVKCDPIIKRFFYHLNEMKNDININ